MSAKIFAAAAFVAAVLPTALAGTASVKNNCDFPVYITHSAHGTDDQQNEFPAGATYSEPISDSAVCIKIMTQRGFCMDTNCVQLEYTSESQTLWYDLSMINAISMAKFASKGMTVNVTDKGAKQINCAPGANFDHGCQDTYYTPDENTASLSAHPSSDLIMNLCSANIDSKNPFNGASQAVNAGSSAVNSVADGASSVVKSASPSVAAPASSAANQVANAASSTAQPLGYTAAAPSKAATTGAPVKAAVGSNGGPVVEVTITKTIGAREAEETAVEKRHIHAHAHHHRH